MSAPFRPLPLTAGPHRQTLGGYFLRSRLAWPLPVEDHVVDAGAGVRLLCRCTWQPGPRDGRPALVMLHGLGGSDRSTYMLSTGRLAYARGWHVVRMNMRGAGDSVELCPRLYHAGLTADVLAVLNDLAPRVAHVFLAGYSLGGSVALLTAGREREQLPEGLRALAVVCAPLDLAACTASLERPRNRAYLWHYMRSLRDGYVQRQRRAPDVFPAGVERSVHSVRAYDDRITAPHGGFAGVDDYYTRSSPGPFVAALDRPTLLIAARDDPMVPLGSVTSWPLPANGLVTRELTATGGHVGYLGRGTQAPGRFWPAERVLSFFAAQGA